MKEYEELRKLASGETDFYKIQALYKKANRAEREEKFIKELLPKIAEHVILADGNGKYTIKSKIGIVDFFPKSNRLLIRLKNKWINGGDKWIKKEFFRKRA